MDTESRQCDRSRIDRFLNGEMSEEEERFFERHLDTCPICSARLEESTAGTAAWQETRRLLRDEPFDLEPLAGDPSDADNGAATDHVLDDSVRRVVDLLHPTDDPQMLGRIAGYEIVGVIGSGGNGVVLKAQERSLNRYVAIKVLAPHLASSGAARGRFAREARAAAAVVHENVIAIHGVAEHAGLPYLVMPCVLGTSLRRRIADHGPLSVVEILRIAAQTAHGLAAAHAQGLVHRDIKPANILLADGVERVTITDFGLARAMDDASMTRSGTVAGTPQFMSPEQARGDTVDHRSDLFSLGSVLYAMCTGHPPFRAETSYGVLRRICESQPRPIPESNPDIPAWLCRFIARLHAKESQARFQSAAEVADLLSRCVAHVQQPDTQPLPAVLQERHAGVHAGRRRVWLAVSVVGLAVVATSAALIWGRSKPGRPIPKPREAVQAEAPPSLGPSESPDLRWSDDVGQTLNELEQGIAELEEDKSPLLDGAVGPAD